MNERPENKKRSAEPSVHDARSCVDKAELGADHDTLHSLTGKVALVTGSSRGIGEAIAKRFAAEGAKVAIHGRDVEALSIVQTAIERAGGIAIRVQADVTEFAEIEAMRARIEDELGPVDVLVANAAGSSTRLGPVETTGAPLSTAI